MKNFYLLAINVHRLEGNVCVRVASSRAELIDTMNRLNALNGDNIIWKYVECPNSCVKKVFGSDNWTGQRDWPK